MTDDPCRLVLDDTATDDDTVLLLIDTLLVVTDAVVTLVDVCDKTTDCATRTPAAELVIFVASLDTTGVASADTTCPPNAMAVAQTAPATTQLFPDLYNFLRKNRFAVAVLGISTLFISQFPNFLNRYSLLKRKCSQPDIIAFSGKHYEKSVVRQRYTGSNVSQNEKSLTHQLVD